MTDRNEPDTERSPSEKWRDASARIVRGVEDSLFGIINLTKYTWEVMGQEFWLRVLRIPIALAITGLVGSVGQWILSGTISYLLTDGAATSPDVEVATTPLALGVSVTVLMISLTGVTVLCFIGYVQLRRRIEDIEQSL